MTETTNQIEEPLIEYDKERKVYICRICGKEFKTFYEVDSHLMLDPFHRQIVEELYYKSIGMHNVEVQVSETIYKSTYVAEQYDVRELYKEGPYWLKINEETILRANSWKELFRAYLTWLYQNLEGIEQAMPDTGKALREAFNAYGLDEKAWKEIFLELLKTQGIDLKNPRSYKDILQAMKICGWILDFGKD